MCVVESLLSSFFFFFNRWVDGLNNKNNFLTWVLLHNTCKLMQISFLLSFSHSHTSARATTTATDVKGEDMMLTMAADIHLPSYF